jgi:hypothetical protein
MVLKVWAPPMCHFFACLVVQNRLWTSYCLSKRGWRYQAVCQLCKCHPETTRHILFESHYYKRVWRATASWLSCPSLVEDLGAHWPTVFQYWHAMSRSLMAVPKGLSYHHHSNHLGYFEREKAIVFNKKSYMPYALLQMIKDERKNWIFGGGGGTWQRFRANFFGLA